MLCPGGAPPVIGPAPDALASTARPLLPIAGPTAAANVLESWQGWSGSWMALPPVMHGIWPANTSGVNFMSSRTQTWSM